MTKDGPIIIGGMGGSGTRVLALVLREAGVRFGKVLNNPLDNKWFGYLFNRPQWYLHGDLNKHDVFNGLKIVEKSIIGPFLLSPKQVSFIFSALKKPKSTNWTIRKREPLLPTTDVKEINLLKVPQTSAKEKVSLAFTTLRANILPKFPDFWGYKVPVSTFYIDYLAELYPNMKYIYVMRSGLDMAYSNNQREMFNWGPVFNIKFENNLESIRKAALQYWLELNRLVERKKKALGEKKILTIRFEDIVTNPEKGIGAVADFIGMDLSGSQVCQLCGLIKKPSTLNRYRVEDNKFFGDSLLRAVEEFGYPV